MIRSRIVPGLEKSGGSDGQYLLQDYRKQFNQRGHTECLIKKRDRKLQPRLFLFPFH